jgi:hypothetical protein
MLAGDDMAKYSVCDLAYNDEPHMRACLDSVAAVARSWLWSISTVPIDWVGTYCRGIGVSTVTVFDPFCNRPLVRWQPFGDGVIFTPDVPTYVRGCVKLVSIGIVLTGLP